MHLLRTIERYLRATGMPATKFGREAMGDPRFVLDLRNGRDPRQVTVDRVTAYLAGSRSQEAPAMIDAHQALLDALRARIDGDHDLVAGESSSRAWASATFIGARHCYSAMLSGPAASVQASKLAGGLDAMEFDLRGHLVADIALVSRCDTQEGVAMTLEALTVEDR